MCFLKDEWQDEWLRPDREADIYRILKKEGVQYVASMRLGGDVVGMETETQRWVEEFSPDASHLRGKMVCHRLVLDTIAHDLSTFSWCKVLLSCIADAPEAAQQAYKVGILHHDLSAGNIMIVKGKETKEWRGVLLDWDMCILWEKHKGKLPMGRTGTLAFMSVQTLRSPFPVAHTLWDDMQFAFWVLLYQTLLYLKHSLGPYLYHTMQNIFHTHFHEAWWATGGERKQKVLRRCSNNESHLFPTQFSKPGFNNFLNELGKAVKERDSDFNLDDPSEQWFIDHLREAARKMEPLCITPTALKLPTNDSNPPNNCRQWEPVSRRVPILMTARNRVGKGEKLPVEPSMGWANACI